MVAFVVLGAALIGLGLLLTLVLLPAGLGAEDASWRRWFVPERTPTLNAVTRIGSDLGSSGVILAASVLLSIAALLCALLAARSMAAAETEPDRPAAPPPPADSPPEVAS